MSQNLWERRCVAALRRRIGEGQLAGGGRVGRHVADDGRGENRAIPRPSHTQQQLELRGVPETCDLPPGGHYLE